jgi:WD40 repeat protein
VVYLATRADDEPQNQVAIKLIQPGPPNNDLLRRFRRERQILASLDHPNIARLLDGGTTAQGVPYLAMEYIAGMPITQYCDQQKLSITERLKLFRNVCAAVQYAHQNLVIHRDLKPGNILVTADGEVKLLDFGIAKLLDTDSGPVDSNTTSGLHVMTPEYASPEQIQGEPITTTSDVYALGVVLYELMTGHYPYRFKDRSLPEIIRVICEQEPEPPSRAISRVETHTEDNGQSQTTISPETVSRTREGKPDKLRARLRGDLNDIALMALRKDPQQRYRSVEQLSEDIRRHLQGRPVLVRKATFAYRASKFMQRYKTGVAAAAIILVILLGGIIATLRQASIARQLVRDKRRVLYAAQMNQAEQAWETTNIARLRELIENQLPQPGEEDLRGFEWRYLWRLIHHNGERFTLQHPIEVWTVAYSPDGNLLATGDDAGLLRLWNTATGQEVATLSGHEKFILNLAFSPDGKRLATASGDKTVKLWDTATWQEIMTLKGHEKRVNVVTFSADGKRLASSADDGTAKVWDAASGQLLSTIHSASNTDRIRFMALSPDGETLALAMPPTYGLTLWDTTTGKQRREFRNVRSVAPARFSPDGKQLALISGRTASILDVSTGKEIIVCKGHRSTVHAVAFSADGKQLATGSMDRTAKIWDIVSGAEINTLKGHEGEIWAIAFSSDGKTLATGSNDFTVKLWDIAAASASAYIKNNEAALKVTFSPDGNRPVIASYSGYIVKLLDAESGKQIATLAGHANSVISAAFSPDGQTLATGDDRGMVKLWNVASQKETASLKAHLDTVDSMMFSPDGTSLATASRDQTAKLWDAATGQLIVALTAHRSRLSAIAFSPDGQWLATAGHDCKAKLWDAKTGRERLTLQGHTKPVLSLAFSPDGKTLATGAADSIVKLWEAATGIEQATFTGNAGHVKAVAFSPDGKRLATGSDEGVVRLWDMATGQEVIALAGHTDSVTSVAFSPDGDTLVSGSWDGTVRFWRAASREETLTQRPKE